MGSTTGNSGILSGVFSLVSREFESFIANASGSTRPPSVQTEREAKNKARRKCIEKVVALSEEDDLPSKCSRRSSKPQLPRSLKRRSSMSMPGSLFPRSPSMEPDANPFSVENEQRVRFAARISDPQSPRRPSSRGSTSTSVSPRRHSQIVTSVKTAVDKFHIGEDDADPSILLPSPKRSPHALVASRNQSRRKSSPSPSTAVSTKHKNSHSVESVLDDCDDTSEFLPVKGKEEEFIAARGELYETRHRDSEAPASSAEQAGNDRNGDKIRIKMLEEEIGRLKQELSRRPVFTPFGLEEVPPPPPPPPPPLPYLPKKILLNVPAAPESHLFASARASLKQAPAPVENPINPLIGRRAGQPTVGLAADKMAAFLNEMKTVRLRKVSERSSGDHSAPPPERFNAQSALRRSASQRSQPAIPLPKSVRALNIATSALNGSEIRVSEKRKRNTNTPDDADPPPKRRLRISSTDSSLATGSSLDSSSSLLPEGTTSLSDTKATTAGRTWQSGSFPEAPTPSLCSDNDIEREDISLYDQPPSTPPAVGPSRHVYRFKGSGIPVESSKEVDVGMHKSSDTTYSGRNFRSSFSYPKPNVFEKRLPSSPFPNKSPRRPRPPSRIPRPTPNLAPPSQQEDHSEEDPFSLPFSFPDHTFPSTAQRQTTSQLSTRSRDAYSSSPSSGSSSRARRRSASRGSRRRRTLDEELRDIPINHHEDLADEAIFTGVGTRSKGHGFLAHGGAGGAPVFMGIGYVDSGEVNDTYATYPEADADDEYLPSHSTRGRNRQR